eukprot:gene18278-biopygen3925
MKQLCFITKHRTYRKHLQDSGEYRGEVIHLKHPRVQETPLEMGTESLVFQVEHHKGRSPPVEQCTDAGVARTVSHFWLWGGAGMARTCPVPPGHAGALSSA